MNRKILLCILYLSFTIPLKAQFGNEWINFSQEYYKIATAKDGLYRLTFADLQNAGIPVSTIDPRNIQVFHRGIEQSISIEGQGDGSFDNTDFIEFYGRKNDGTLDQALYSTGNQPHPYHNLFSDSTYYFLTVAASAGKRVTQFFENNSTNIPKEGSHTDKKLLVIANQYGFGYLENSYLSRTVFDQGEGWTGTEIRQNQFQNYTLSGVINGVQAMGLPALEVLLVGRGGMAHVAEILVGPSTGSLRTLGTINFSGFENITFTQDLSWTDVAADGTLIVQVKALGAGGADRLSASYIQVTYPQSFTTSGAEKTFFLSPNAGNTSYIEIDNPQANQKIVDVTDPTNLVYIGTTTSGTLNAVIPNTSTARKLLVTNLVGTPIIKKINFQQIVPAAYDYIIITHKDLRKPTANYSDPVLAYASYRASSVGGSYSPLLVDIDQLYHQFNYGEISPRAIFNFMKYLAATNLPKYLFIVGRGLDVSGNYHRNPAAYPVLKDFVPPAGNPGADMFYTAGLSGEPNVPAVPTGRITATKSEHVAAYFDKVKEMEALPLNALWRKDLLHLSGGIEEGEPELFSQFMEEFGAIAKEQYMGAEVTAVAKHSTEVAVTVNVAEYVNKGLNLVTFFGHSSSVNLDFDVGFVSDPVMGYDNKGKYPMFLINGCNAGAFSSGREVFGEDWINTPDKGAVGFIAHSYFGYVSTLRAYSNTFYEVAYGDSTFLKQGIGDIQKEVAKRYFQKYGTSTSSITQVQQMMLLGDPAVKLFGADKPDYEINDTSITLESYDGEPITALADSFALKINIRNFGRAQNDSVRVRVTRTFNDNSSTTHDSIYYNIYYLDEVVFNIRKDRTSGFGNNSFSVEIDPEGDVDELNEANNTGGATLFIPLNGTKNLYPLDFGIVNETNINLVFQSTNLITETRTLLVEVDTVHTFDSPYKKEFSVDATTIATQPFELASTDSLSYYWRTKLANPLPGENDAWIVSTFTFINNGPEGWVQRHFPQYLDNNTIGLIKDPELRELRFVESTTPIDIHTYGGAHPASNTDVSVKIGGAEFNLTQQGFICRDNTINLIAFDKSSTVPYPGIAFTWRNSAGRICGREPNVINSFRWNELETGNGDDIFQWVDNIPEGDSVVLYSVGNAGYPSWSANVINKLGELGISTTQITTLVDGEPIVIFGKKGIAPGAATLLKTSSVPLPSQELMVNKTITGRYTDGVMKSALIGPALSWQQLLVEAKNNISDVHSFDVVGVDLKGNETILLSDITTTTDLSFIDPETYPTLRLIFKTEDLVNLTATQLKKWLVAYTPVPEGILSFEGTDDPIVLDEGSTWIGKYGFTNISGTAFPDSVTVRKEVYNQMNRSSSTIESKIKSPAPGAVTAFTFEVNTLGRIGLNDVNVFVNPRIIPEQYYENNVLELPGYLNVSSDNFKPVLEVSIDGRVVQNGDVVSRNPIIQVTLWDQNQILLKQDTVGISVLLGFPCDENDCLFTRINFSDIDVEWSPATSFSDFNFSYSPANLADGLYSLRVEAADASGNVSGDGFYEVSFVVQADASIQFLPVYPNPSNNVFVFPIQVNGDENANALELSIISLDGKLIQTLTTPNALHVGKNEIIWDGKNASGNFVPAGIYVYQLKVSATDGDKIHRGKLVVIH